jgi:hypothetical protein
MLISEFLQILEYSARKSSVHRYLVLDIESADELVTAINMHMIRSMITRIRFENVSPSLLPTHNRRVSAMIRPCKPSKFPRVFGDHCGADLLDGRVASGIVKLWKRRLRNLLRRMLVARHKHKI